MAIRKFFKWCVSSLPGHIVLFALTFSVPMLIAGLTLNYMDGTLTWDWAPYIALYCALGGFAVAVVIWFVLTSPLLRRRGGS
jgi:hypothetical protein